MVRMKNTKYSSQVAGAFTLIELLVVISIIAILAGMVMPMVYSAKERAREAKTRVAAKELEIAFKSYLDTYKVWPPEFVDGPLNGDIFRIMCGQNVNNSANPQLIAFYEFESTNTLVANDSWLNPYQVWFDRDYDNKITIGGLDAYRCVVVWSPGKLGDDDSGGGDDVASWK